MPQRPVRAGKRAPNGLLNGPTQITSQPERSSVARQQAFRRLRQQSLARAVHQSQLLTWVEREGGDVDLFHDFAQQRGGFQCPQALIAQRSRHGVYLLHHFAERFFGIIHTGPDAVIAFTQSFQQVRQSSQRPRNAAARGEAKAKPEQNEQRIDGDLHASLPAFHGEQNRTGSDGG